MAFFPDNSILFLAGIVGLLICLWILAELVLVLVALARKKPRYAAFTPAVTVIVPAYNEEESIDECIRAILHSDYPARNLRVICVDDGSTDTTRAILHALARKDKRLTILDGKHKGKSAALNMALRASTTPFVVTIDADTLVEKQFLRSIIAPFAVANVGATHGMGQITRPRGALGWWQETEYAMNNLMRTTFERTLGSGLWFFGAAAGFRKTALDAAGGFRADTLTEDMDVSLAIGRASYTIVAVEDARYTTQACATFSEFFKQRIRWFGGGLECLLKNLRSKTAVAKRERATAASRILYVNHFFWSIISFLLFPLYFYQVWYWWPTTLSEQFWYVFRWLTITGPVYVFYMYPQWELSFVSVFGCTAGILSFVLLMMGLVRARRLGVRTVLAAATMFPYTVILTATWIVSVPIGLFVRRGFGAATTTKK